MLDMKTFNFNYTFGKTRGEVSVEAMSEVYAMKIAELMVIDRTGKRNATLVLASVTDWK